MKRIRRWLGWTLLTFILLSLIPVLLWRWLPPPVSAVILARSLEQGVRQEYVWVPLEQIAPAAALAVVAAEDQKFPHHAGFDFVAIRGALRHNAAGGSLRGASTLSQQLAKNLFLWEGRSYLRKALEAWFTTLLELTWPKRRIIEVYLNLAEMGEGVFGIEAASRRFFGRPASALNRSQAALLAAVLPSPRRYHADRPSARVLARRDWILQQMDQLGGASYLQTILDPGG